MSTGTRNPQRPISGEVSRAHVIQSLSALIKQLGSNANRASTQPDNVSTYNVQVAGSASITTGKGDDNLYLWILTVGGPLDVRTGRGDDTVLAQTDARKELGVSAAVPSRWLKTQET
jgi:hypothetical protein